MGVDGPIGPIDVDTIDNLPAFDEPDYVPSRETDWEI